MVACNSLCPVNPKRRLSARTEGRGLCPTRSLPDVAPNGKDERNLANVLSFGREQKISSSYRRRL